MGPYEQAAKIIGCNRRAIDRLVNQRKLPKSTSCSLDEFLGAAQSYIDNKLSETNGDPRSVLVIGDLHIPCVKKGYLEHCLRQRDKYNCGHVIFIGDVVNCGLLGYHEFDPDWDYSPAQEIELAREQVEIWERAFPNAHVMIGNHDALPYRKAKSAGIPRYMIKDPEHIWNTKSWTWHQRFSTYNYDGVAYRHGDKGKGGQSNPAFLNAKDNFCSMVQGHFHGLAGIEYMCNEEHVIFGMQVGTGMDWKTAEMSYGLKFNKKPMLSCGIVREGRAYLELMKL